jgi:hypothetical protein
MAVPLVVVALVQIGVGGAVRARTGRQVAALVELREKDSARARHLRARGRADVAFARRDCTAVKCTSTA